MDTAILEVAVTASIAEYVKMHRVSKTQRGESEGCGIGKRKNEVRRGGSEGV